MATKTKERPRTEKSVEQTEVQKVAAWRQEQFVSVLVLEGQIPSDEVDYALVQRLVESDEISPHDLRKLIKNGCDPNIAIEILS